MDHQNHYHHIANSPSLDALLSTLYSPSIAVPEPSQGGFFQSIFGSPDPYLSNVQSLPPQLNNAASSAVDTAVDSIIKADIPDYIQNILQDVQAKGEAIVDPTQVTRSGLPNMPGFSPTKVLFSPTTVINEKTVFPVYFEAQPLETKMGVMIWEAENLRILSHLPVAIFVALVFDFFIVTPGLEQLNDEDIDIEDDAMDFEEDAAVARAITSGLTRGLFLLTICGIYLTLSS